jgi:hypothetical protein
LAAALAGVLRKGRESEDGRGKRERGEAGRVSAFDGKWDEFPLLAGSGGHRLNSG